MTNTLPGAYLLQERKEGGRKERKTSKGRRKKHTLLKELQPENSSLNGSEAPPLCGLTYTLTISVPWFPFENREKTVPRLGLEMEAEEGQLSEPPGFLSARGHTTQKMGVAGA